MLINKIIFTVLLALTLSGCLLPEPKRDYYSELKTDCDFTRNNYDLGTRQKLCRQKILGVLNIDNSFDARPEIREALLDAIQYLLAMPLKLPKNGRLLGRANYSFTDDFYQVINESPSYNQSLINWALNLFTKIIFLDEPHEFRAFYNYDRTLKITERFLYSSHELANVKPNKQPLHDLASVLIHEAKHGSSQFHPPSCTSKTDCDSQLNSPHGFATFYLEMLLQKSGLEDHILTSDEIFVIGQQICIELMAIQTLSAELQAIITETQSCDKITLAWVIENEGRAL